jgi:hypothetical protein
MAAMGAGAATLAISDAAADVTGPRSWQAPFDR